MSRPWEQKKQTLRRELEQCAKWSPVLEPLMCGDGGDEWRALLMLHTKTLVRKRDGQVGTAGPVVVGIRYHERFLSEAPHPLEIVTVIEPGNIFHPNCAASGALCLGHPVPGLTLETILHQVWAGLTLNMKVVAIQRGEIVNQQAAAYVRANRDRFPLTNRGLFEQPV